MTITQDSKSEEKIGKHFLGDSNEKGVVKSYSAFRDMTKSKLDIKTWCIEEVKTTNFIYQQLLGQIS